jgi:hypothetical protein
MTLIGPLMALPCKSGPFTMGMKSFLPFLAIAYEALIAPSELNITLLLPFYDPF